MTTKPTHPLKTWMEERNLDCGDVAALLARIGRETSAEYIRHIAFGYKRPSYDFAKDIARATKQAVSVESIMEFPTGQAA